MEVSINTNAMKVNYEQKPCYDIVFSKDFNLLNDEIQQLNISNKRICIVTESNVGPLYANEVKDIFPNKKGESAAVLFINKEVRRNINSGNLKKEDNDTVVMSNSEFDEFIIEVRRTHGHGFTKTLRDVSEQVFINIIRNFMKDFSMIREEKDFTILMPIIGKVLGEYPEEYKGEAKDE